MRALERSWVMLGLLALATAVLLHGNLTAPFYRLDDQRYVCYATEGSWTRLFRPRQGMSYAPVTYLSFRLDRALFGPAQEEVRYSFAGQPSFETASRDPLSAAPQGVVPVQGWAHGPRLMNGLCHLLASFFLWLFLARLGAGAGTAAMVALLWAVHPAALESVAWVCERKNALCACFGFAALLAWTAPREKAWRAPLVWLLFGLALFSKAAALSLVPVFVALELLDPPRGGFAWRDGRRWPAALKFLSGLLALAAFQFGLSLRVLAEDVAPPPGGSLWTALLTDADIFWRYTLNLLLPENLSFFYAVEPIEGLADRRLWVSGGGLALLWSALLWSAGKTWRPLALLGGVWFFGGLGPNANLIASTYPMQDRFCYLPAPGLFLALGLAFRGLAARSRRSDLPLAGVLYVLLMAVLCAERSWLFGDDAKLEFDAVRRQPGAGVARWNVVLITQARFLDCAAGVSEAQRRRAAAEARELARQCEAALACRDICDFVDPLTLRAALGEALFFLGDYAGTRAVVEAGLPPPGPLPEPQELGRLFPGAARPGRRVRPMFFRASLARAHVLLGELSLRDAYLKAAAPEQRLASARDAVAHAEQSRAAHPLHDEALVLKGKALIRSAYLHAAAGAREDARQAYAQAKAILTSLPAGSAQAESARRILENVPPPDEPQPRAGGGAP